MMIGMCDGRQVLADAKFRSKQCFCPVCGEPVVLKIGCIKMPHFAHRKGANCSVSEGETSEHLLGKKQIFEWAGFHGYQPQYEVYLPEIKQRPDLLLTTQNGQKIAVEFQCSPLSRQRLSERNMGYRQLKIQVWWFLGMPYFKRKLSREKQAQFLQPWQGKLRLLFWSTVDNRVVIKRLDTRRELVPQRLHTTNMRQLILMQTQQLQHRVMTADSEIRAVQLKCYLQQHNIIGIPLVCHYLEDGFSPFQTMQTFWRVEVLLALEQHEVGDSWPVEEWYDMIDNIGEPWCDFVCLSDKMIARIHQTTLSKYTKELLQAGILQRQNKMITYRQSAQWFINYQLKIAYLAQLQK